FDYSMLFENLKNNGFLTIILTGGEPLIYPEIYEIIKLSKKINFETLLLTNAQIIDNNICENLKNSGLDGITISLSNLIELNDTLENKIDFYEQKINIIEKYFDFVTSTFLITSKNFKYIHRIYKKFSNDTNRSVIFQPLYLQENSDNFDKYSLSKISDDDWKEIKQQLSDWMIKHNTYSYIQLFHDLIKGIKPTNMMTCFMGTSAVIIDYYGDVYPCFHRKDLYAGNILKHNFKDLIINTLYKSDSLVSAPCISTKCVSLFLSYV
ncbi:MAG TPA: radical SAM protein, partial [bacterium]|nr:radical SAM protein [bacterium]